MRLFSASLLVALACLVLVGCDAPSSTPYPPTIKRGDSVTVSPGSGKIAIAFASASDYETGNKYYRADDRTGMARMVVEGRAFTIEHGTKAKVLERDGLAEIINLRITSGTHSGTEVWMRDEWAKP